MTHYICTAAAIFLIICGLIAAFGLLMLGFSAVTAMLNIPPWMPLPEPPEHRPPEGEKNNG